MFILEIRKASEKGSINNAGHFQTDVVAVEAEIKDESRAPNTWTFYAFGTADAGQTPPGRLLLQRLPQRERSYR